MFDHLAAADSVLVNTVAQSRSTVPQVFRDFLTEYFIYTATLSVVSTDAISARMSIVSPQLKQSACELVAAGYVGNLCGCWLALLLQIPDIFALATMVLPRQQMANNSSNGNEDDDDDGGGCATMMTVDEVAIFARLQSEILAWTPSATPAPDVGLVGSIFQQAMLLYLYTSISLERPSSCLNGGSGSRMHGLLQDAIAKTLVLLAHLPVAAQVNTNLLWPIAVVGACVETPEQRDMLRTRLEDMGRLIGLGNISKTRLILEALWRLPEHEVTPWIICRVMVNNKIWISFA